MTEWDMKIPEDFFMRPVAAVQNHASELTLADKAELSFSTTASGVPAGANMPVQPEISNAGKANTPRQDTAAPRQRDLVEKYQSFMA